MRRTRVRNVFYSILLNSVIFILYSILLYSVLFYSILFYSILFYSVPFLSIPFYSILFYAFCNFIINFILFFFRTFWMSRMALVLLVHRAEVEVTFWGLYEALR